MADKNSEKHQENIENEDNKKRQASKRLSKTARTTEEMTSTKATSSLLDCEPWYSRRQNKVPIVYRLTTDL